MIYLLIYGLLIFGMAFHLIGVLALHRFFDPYTRLHGSTLCTTFGSIAIVLSIVIYSIAISKIQIGLHAIVALIFLMITNAVASHAIARASYKAGIKPEKLVVNALKR